MLVLSRKKNETIEIGREVTVVVVEIRGDKARLGIEAPRVMPVHRGEVAAAIARGGDPESLEDPRLASALATARALGRLAVNLATDLGRRDAFDLIARFEQDLETVEQCGVTPAPRPAEVAGP